MSPKRLPRRQKDEGGSAEVWRVEVWRVTVEPSIEEQREDGWSWEGQSNAG